MHWTYCDPCYSLYWIEVAVWLLIVCDWGVLWFNGKVLERKSLLKEGLRETWETNLGLRRGYGTRSKEGCKGEKEVRKRNEIVGKVGIQ